MTIVIHVVRLDLTADFDPSALTAAERERGARFGSAERRRRWEAGRCGLRRILSEALEVEAADVALTRGAHGKPTVAGSDVQFNKTDCGDLALVAVCRGRELGIDLEAHRRVLRAERIAARFFSPDEQEWLHAAKDPIATFFDLWTTKEAVLKCDGGGLGAFPMAGFTAPTDRRAGGAVSGRWWVQSLDMGESLSAAVAVDGPESADVRFG